MASSTVTAEMAKMAPGWSSDQFSVRVYDWSSQWKKPDFLGLLIGLAVGRS